VKDLIPGGKADNMPDRAFSKKELKKGQRHELEHTKSRALAKEIAKDHIVEDPRYYEHLAEMEKKAMFTTGFTKVAILKTKHVEDELGLYLDKKHLPEAEQHIQREKDERFALRHPWLTGIPTLGMWPMISRSSAAEEVARKLLRNHPELRKQLGTLQEQEHQREVELMAKHIAEREANARENMMAMGASTALSGLNSYLRHKKHSED
jgi:hypothetical protein